METEAELTELTERIRRSVVRSGGGTASATAESLLLGELPPVPTKLLPPGPVTNEMHLTEADQPTHESLLAIIGGMIGRARDKNRVPKGIPAILRPFFRNQGGVNGTVVETLDHLAAANRQLRQQNLELQERLLAMQGWVNAATQTQARNREWIIAADARLRAMPETRITHVEERLRTLEEREDAR